MDACIDMYAIKVPEINTYLSLHFFVMESHWTVYN